MQVVDLVRDGLNDTMPEFGEETNRGESITDAWDFVQENLECCGVNNYTDWADDPNVNSYPASCCSNDPVVNASSNQPPCSLANVYRDVSHKIVQLFGLFLLSVMSFAPAAYQCSLPFCPLHVTCSALLKCFTYEYIILSLCFFHLRTIVLLLSSSKFYPLV
jgi:hypothetical protein